MPDVQRPIESCNIFQDVRADTYTDALMASGLFVSRKEPRALAKQGGVWLVFTGDFGEGVSHMVWEPIPDADAPTPDGEYPFVVVFGKRRNVVRLTGRATT